jgi:hypothetical protein
MSPSLVRQAHEVSTIGTVPKSVDLSWSSQGLEQRDEPAARICNPSSDEARISSCPSLEEGKKELGLENLEPSSGDFDSPARGAVDDGFVTPIRYAKNVNGSVSRSSWTSNEQYFPKWFDNPWVGKSQKKKEFCCSDSSSDDELSDIEDRFSSSYTDTLVDVLPNIQPVSSLEDDLADMLGDSSICYSDTGSSGNGVLQPLHKRHSIHGNYKHPKRPHRSRLCLPLFGISVIDSNNASDQLEAKHAKGQSVSRGEGPSNTATGKFKVPPDMAELNAQDTGDDQEQINLDYQIAVELERRLNKVLRKSQKLEKKNKQLKEELHTLREKSEASNEPSRVSSSLKKSRTPLGIGGQFDRASSRLPARSGLMRAIQGYSNSVKTPPSSSPRLRSSHRLYDRNKGGREVDNRPSESTWSSDEDIFSREPESDHPSDSEGTKRRKREKRQRHRAKLNALKYHQNFMKSDPPFKYNGEVQVSLFKKWCHEIRDWVKDGQLGSRRGIRQSGKYLSGKAYRFYEQEILQNEKKFTLTEYFAALFDYIFPADFRMQQRDEFDSCRQEDLSAVDYLRQLQDLADTVGDLEDTDIVLAFWRRCQSYIRSELTRAGYEPSILTVDDLETLANRIERAEEASCEAQMSPPYDNEEPDSNVQPSDGGSLESEKSSENEHQRIQRLREERKCFLCESSEHLARSCPTRRSKGLSAQLNSIGMSATEIKLAALAEGLDMGLFVIENEAHLMGGLPGEDSEMTSAGRNMLEYFANLQSEVEGDTNTGEDHSQNSESNDDEFEDLPDLEPTANSEDEQNDSDWYSYWDLPISYSRRDPDDNINSPGSLTVFNGGPVEDLEGESIHSRRRVVPKDRILSEQLEGESVPNIVEIVKNKRVADATNDAPFYHATEGGQRALLDPIAFSLEVYPDMILFQTREDGIVNRLGIEVLSAVSTNNGSARIDYSLCVNNS